MFLILIKIIITLSLISLLWWRKNIIMILLNMELMMISLFMMISLSNNMSSNISAIILLTFMVTGSSIGLSLLISLSRSFLSSNSIFLWILIFVNYF